MSTVGNWALFHWSPGWGMRGWGLTSQSYPPERWRSWVFIQQLQSVLVSRSAWDHEVIPQDFWPVQLVLLDKALQQREAHANSWRPVPWNVKGGGALGKGRLPNSSTIIAFKIPTMHHVTEFYWVTHICPTNICCPPLLAFYIRSNLTLLISSTEGTLLTHDSTHSSACTVLLIYAGHLGF